MSIRAASTSTSLRVSAGCACTRLSGTLISSRSSLDVGSSPWPTSNQERLTPKIPARAAKRLLRGDALPCSHFATVDAFTPHSFAISACVRPATTRASAIREPTSLAGSSMPRGCASRSPSRKPCSELVGCCSAIRHPSWGGLTTIRSDPPSWQRRANSAGRQNGEGQHFCWLALGRFERRHQQAGRRRGKHDLWAVLRTSTFLTSPDGRFS